MLYGCKDRKWRIHKHIWTGTMDNWISGKAWPTLLLLIFIKILRKRIIKWSFSFKLKTPLLHCFNKNINNSFENNLQTDYYKNIARCLNFIWIEGRSFICLLIFGLNIYSLFSSLKYETIEFGFWLLPHALQNSSYIFPSVIYPYPLLEFSTCKYLKNKFSNIFTL